MEKTKNSIDEFPKYGFNANAIYTLTRKRNHKGHLISQKKLINDNCWYHICNSMDWITWSNMITAYPQFKSFKDGRKLKTLVVESSTIINENIMVNSNLIKDLVIEDHEYQSELMNGQGKFERMTEIENLSIVDVEHNINYIRSTKIKKLAICGTIEDQDILDPLPIDNTTTLLQICRKLKEIRFNEIYLDNTSINSLILNPIEKLSLINAHFIYPENEKYLLQNSKKLTDLTMAGEWSVSLQKTFFDRQLLFERRQIRKLTLQLLPDLENHYVRINDCSNLEQIHIFFNGFLELNIFLKTLMRSKNLTFSNKTFKRIKLIKITATNRYEMLDKMYRSYFLKFFIEFQLKFKEMGVYLMEYEEKLFDNLMDAVLSDKNI